MKNGFRRTVTGVFTGAEFTIRRVDLRDYMIGMGVLPFELAGPVSERLSKLRDGLEAKAKEDPTLEERSVKFYLMRGVVRPKIWFGADEECPDDQVPVEDLGGDKTFLVSQIVAFSSEMPGLETKGEGVE